MHKAKQTKTKQAQKRMNYMDFCPNCGSILIPKIVEAGSQVIVLLQCKKCGYKNKGPKQNRKFELKTIQHSPKQMVAVIDRNVDISTETTIPIECPSCSNNLGYVWQVQTRGADESSTQFIRCTKCGYTYRESA
jgi:DNA-directed RNA polymerase subunit M